jgi:hypothetical protein
MKALIGCSISILYGIEYTLLNDDRQKDAYNNLVIVNILCDKVAVMSWMPKRMEEEQKREKL